MRTILTLVRKDLANFLSNRAAVVLTFIVPVVLIYIFGLVFGLNRKDSAPSGIRLYVVNESADPGAQKLVDALKAEKGFRVSTTLANPDKTSRPLTEADARAAIHNRDVRWALVIPADFMGGDSLGLHLRILSNPQNEIESQLVNGLLQKTVFSNVPELLGQSLRARAKSYLGAPALDRFNDALAGAIAGAFGGDRAKLKRRLDNGEFLLTDLDAPAAPANAGGAAPATQGATNDFFSRLINIEKVQLVGKEVKSPDATRIIGGQAIMFLLFALSNSAAAFFDEKNSGIFQRLLAAPVSRGQLLWARFLFGVAIGVIQLLVLFTAGQLLFGVDVSGHLGLVLLVCVAAAAACTSFGMLVAAFTPNAQAASGLATLLVLTMSATGGAWFPLSIMPEFMQHVGKFTLVYWSMEGFLQVLWADNSLFQLLPTLGILLAIAVSVMTLSVWRLNRRALFG